MSVLRRRFDGDGDGEPAENKVDKDKYDKDQTHNDAAARNSKVLEKACGATTVEKG